VKCSTLADTHLCSRWW